MVNLTRQEQRVLAVALGLLLVGLAVKAWRAVHLPEAPAPARVAGS